MEALQKLRQRNVVGLFNKLGHVYWSLKSRLYFAPQFGAFGRGSIIKKPMLIANPGGIRIGARCSIRDGARLEIVDRPGLPMGSLILGNDVNIEQNVHIAACSSIEIADLVCIAAGAAIVDTTHPVGFPDDGNRATQINMDASHVRIGRRVFIGVNAVILPNVTIGENSIIGAGSVVTGDIPANSIAVGAPARVVRTLPVDRPNTPVG
ncbi:acyltransferase [Cryobacterium arcticum]|uniref:Acetyltransferase n=1 Tax=Cryobacterium arcticum TaxID=670052 RepID=A0A1B1BMY7_9MICO|nr:acyltransferase [Cryobacterium arcticum]ANP73905.1 Acetyltransferase [Cryobacterium arcticum]